MLCESNGYQVVINTMINEQLKRLTTSGANRSPPLPICLNTYYAVATILHPEKRLAQEAPIEDREVGHGLGTIAILLQ